jgi:Ca-activated chloride channel homolog
MASFSNAMRRPRPRSLRGTALPLLALLLLLLLGLAPGLLAPAPLAAAEQGNQQGEEQGEDKAGQGQPPGQEKPGQDKEEGKREEGKKKKETRADRQAQKKAIEALPKTYRDWLEEVDVLITAEEKAAFLVLDKDYQRDAFIKRFWEARDPYKGTSRNELHERWKTLVDEARTQFGNLKDERSRVLLLNGLPSARVVPNCSSVLAPVEVWFYKESEQLSFEFFVVFYQRWGSGPFRIWEPSDGVEALFAFMTEPGRRDLNSIAQGCRDGDLVAAAINWVARQGLDYSSILMRFTHPQQGPGGEWVAAFNTYSTDLPADAQTFTAAIDFDFPGRHQNRTVVQGVVSVPSGEVGQAKLGEHRSYNFALTGEVLQDGSLFDSFRYKFDLPATDVQEGGAMPLLFQRYLRPGTYNLVLRIEDINSGKFFRSERKLEVPQRENFAPQLASVDPQDVESARLLAEANAAIGTGETTLRIIPPRGDLQTGMLRVDTLSTGAEIDKVTFALDGKPLLTKKKPPYSVELDLGALPRTRRLGAIAYDAQGREVASDEMLLNSAGHRFRVRLTEPQKGKVYQSSVLARALVEVPDGEALERVELYTNDTLVATLYQPPYEQPIVLRKDEPLSYVRAVAYLTDGNSTEHLVFVNTPDYPEEVEVQYVELFTSVLDRGGRPVEGLTEADFTPYEDGVKQQILRFDRVTDLPIHVTVALDVSASMEEALSQVQGAALQFLQSTIKPKDRGSVVTFNDHPRLAVKFTSDATHLAGGLAGLKAERGTALYDSIVFTLYYFNGIKGQRAILLLSDGKDEGSRFSYEDALDYARRAGVTIYAIGLGEDIEKKKLAKFAEETGGRSFFVKDPAQLAAIYADIERELRSQYLIAYQSSNPGGDNASFRTVELKVAKPGLEAKTIRGYYP